MSTRYGWLLAFLILLLIGMLAACGSHYSASSDGLVIVPSQGSSVVQSFSFNLSNGRASAINNPPPINGTPRAIILDSTGSYAYVASSVSCSNTSLSGAVQGVISSYKVNSNGSLAASSASATLLGNPSYPGTFASCGLNDATNPNPGNGPVALAMGAGGKFLLVANQLEAVTFTDNSTNPPTTTSATLPGMVSVLSIGSNGSLTEVSGSPFAIPAVLGGTAPNVVSLSATPAAFPTANAACSAQPAATAQYLYVADAANNDVWQFTVDSSTGALTPDEEFAAGSVPSGVAVDPCNRFVYVANQVSNNISAYTICNAISPSCQQADGSLVPVTGSPYSAGNGPGPMVIDPFGNHLYVVNTLSNQVSGYKISQVAGALTPLGSPTVATASKPVAIAIRSDDSWLFVSNYNSATVSQYSITPASGALSPASTGITTDTFPWGVAVK